MTEKSKTFWKFTTLYFVSIVLVVVAVFKNVKTPPKMKPRQPVSLEQQLLNQEKLLFKIQKINEYFSQLSELENSLEATKNDARKVGRIKMSMNKTKLKLTTEVEKYRNESDKELYVEIFKNFDRMINLYKTNEGLKKENLNAIEELHECKQVYGNMLTLN